MSGQRGFTLIEMVVALTLLGLLLAALTTALGIAGKAWDGGEARAERWQRSQAAQALLRERIEAALPLPEGSLDQPGISFDGGPEALRLVAPTMPPLRPGGFHEIRLAVEGGDLVADWRAWPDGPVERRLLEPTVAGLSLRYFGADKPGGAPSWRGSWEGKTIPPLLVRVELRFAAGDARHWPPLVVAPRLDRRAACAQRIAPPFCLDRRQGIEAVVQAAPS